MPTARLRPFEPAGEPAHQLIRVYAMANGHRTIFGYLTIPDDQAVAVLWSNRSRKHGLVAYVPIR
jgi:hypothetical protein